MQKKLLFSLIIFVALIFDYSNNNSLAYDDKTTHPALTDEIVDFYNLSFPNNQLTSQEKEWIVEGAILEDIAPRWINHFYDPIYQQGWTGEKAGRISPAGMISLATAGFFTENPISVIDWVNNQTIQERYSPYGDYGGDRTWKKGLEYYADGNKEEAYKILGHILHLVEDQSVPDHTRNDTHAHDLEKLTGDYGSPYEEYLKKYNRQTIEKLDIPNSLKKENKQPIIKQSIEDYLISLATYSNKYFFSKDTINDIKYQNPKIIRDDGIFGYGKDENNREFILVKVYKVWSQNKLKYDIDYYLPINDKDINKSLIIDQYFSRLSHQAVLYGAGAINLFQQQARDAIENKDYQAHIFKADTSWLNFPMFSIIGEGLKFFNKLANVFSSAGSLSNTDQISNDLAVVENSVIEQQNPIIEEQTKEQPVEEQLAISEQFEQKEEIKKEETKPQEITQKTEEVISNQLTEQIIEDENISGQNTATTTKVVFKFTSGSSGSSGSVSYGGSYIAPSAPKTYLKILISEIQLASASSTHNEFVELYNPNDASVDLTDWYIQKKTKTGDSFTTFAKADLFSGKTISAKSFLLISHSSSTFAYDIAADYGISDDNTLVVKNPNGEIVDKVGLGEANDCDGVCAANPADGQSIQRKIQSNEFTDTDINASDFEIQICPSPKAQSANCQAANQNATSSEPTATSTISHIVISEIYPDKTGNNFDFVELYNPNNNSIDIKDYSLKIRKESSTSTSSLASFSSGNIIAAKSFFLVGLDNYGSSTNATADVLRSSYSLFTSTSSIVFLMNNDAIVDEINYNPANITSNQSLERKAFATSTADLMATGEHRFSGNGYDTDSAEDFVLRNSAEPQNSQNLPEPRTSPTTPQNFSVQYSSSTMSLSLSWQASQDYSGATSSVSYKITDISNSSSTMAEINTTSTSAIISLNENNFGQTYTFSIQAFDRDSLGSVSSTASILIPNSTSIIAQQTDKSAYEQGTGNGQFYQYLGNGLLDSPQNITFHAKFDYGWVPLGTVKPYYIQMVFKESSNPDYSSSTAISTNTCYFSGNYGPLNNCPDVQIEKGVAKDYTIPVQQSFVFNPEKYYKITLFTYQADTAYFYGSVDANSYSYGKAAKDNGQSAEVDASTVKDLYFKIETATPIEIPVNISQSISQNFEANYSSSTLELALSWDKPRYFDGTSPALTYKINDISYLVSSSTLVLPEITTSATSTIIILNEVGRKYKFSIQAFDANGNSTFIAQSKDISIPFSLLNQFVIAGQADYSVSEAGTGNGQFYQTLGSGLSGSLGAIAIRVSSPGYYISIYGNNVEIARCSANQYYSGPSCSNYYLGANTIAVPVKTSFTFDPATSYKLYFMTYQSQSTFYGSSDENFYASGQSTKDNGNGTEISTSPIKDLYFAILSATPLR